MPKKRNNSGKIEESATKRIETSKLLTKDFESWVNEQSNKLGISKEKIIEETAFITVGETTGELLKLETSQIFKTIEQQANELQECKRLREKFGPVSMCVDWIKDQLIGGGFDVVIDDPKDKYKVQLKDKLLEMMRKVYQDTYTIGLDEIINIMLDDALTTGFSAAEIVYGKQIDFNTYAKPVLIQQSAQSKKEPAPPISTQFDIIPPKWEELEGVRRLKILNDSADRLKLYRDTKTWEAVYWVLDEKPLKMSGTGEAASEKDIIQQSLRVKPAASKQIQQYTFTARFLPWQMFILSINRKKFDEKGTSIILPVLKSALLLEKILNAVGEGIYRSGNKKYFIICGTEARPWGLPHIRNLLKQLQEASQKNWSTIPVPSGFDIKEAGGEIFEATDVVNYFLRVIAEGMHTPSEVVGLPRRTGGGMTFSYQRFRNRLQTAIRLQLFRPHIWCAFGEEHQKQGGASEEHYIPELRIKVEDLLPEGDRLKMCVQLLNVANPVRPEVKLEAEREICKVMGWDKVILPTQDEYNKKAEEQDKLQKQLAEKKLKESQPQDGTSTDRGEKVQGPPQPQNEDMLQKRLEKGVNVRQSISKKGKSRPMGDTRMSKEVVQETVTDEEKPPQRVEITFKHEPQRIELSPVKTEVIVKTETPLDDIMKELVKKNETLVDMRTRLNEEENKRKQEKLRKEIGKLETEINGIEKRIEFEQQKAQTEIDETKKTEEKKREVLEKNEQEKTKAEIEEKRKTEEKKRETLEKINKTINEEQEMIEGKGDSE